MELVDVLRRRRMVRSFTGAPVDEDQLAAMCADSLRAPTAGNTAGVSLTIVPHPSMSAFFDVATDTTWRASAPRAAGLARAGAAVLVLTQPAAYAARYREPDKDDPELGDPAGWPIPYWHADAAMATFALLLLIEDAGWAATFWGAFRHTDAIRRWADAPAGDELFGTVLLGHADGRDRRSGSLDRPVLARADRVRRLDG